MTIIFWFENNALSGDDYNKTSISFHKKLELHNHVFVKAKKMVIITLSSS